MCGIIGTISRNIDITQFIEMRDTLIHRGPDDEGLYLNSEKNVTLGHRRLSIIDLTPKGKQPMPNENGTIWITFNGEIYNYKEIRDELLQLNHTFLSESDTEILIHGYEEWGVKILDKINGMFAFGIWDDVKKQLFLARDRIGIKPLYYYFKDNNFIFASELKAIVADKSVLREINPKALKNYLMFAYVPSPLSIWKDIYKLNPGSYLLFKDGNTVIKKYWNYAITNENRKVSNVCREVRNLLLKSIEYRFISDVPVGVLLSGGMDSSLICALGKEKKEDLLTYSIGFKASKRSELKYAKTVARHLGLYNKSKILSNQNVLQNLDDLLYHYDEPFGISSMFPTFLLMQTVSKDLKVVLSGDGGDELFAGYEWYTRYMKIYRFDFLTPLFRRLYNEIARIFKKKIES